MITFKIIISIVIAILAVGIIYLGYLMYQLDNLLKGHDTDKDALDSEMWRKKTKKILKRDKYRCKYCGGNYKLKVYRKCHEYYPSGLAKLPWEYSDKSYVTICKDCYKLSQEVKAWLPYPLI